MSLLGQGFLPSRPTDGEFVKHPSSRQAATEICDLKTVIKEFFDVSMNLETGTLDEKSIPISSLPTMTPDPSGVYQKMTVDAKGRFTGGKDDEPFKFPQLMRAYFFGTLDIPSKLDTESGPKTVVGRNDISPGGFFSSLQYPHPAAFKFLQYLFTVPKNVFRINYTVVGAPMLYSDPRTYAKPLEHGPATRIGSMAVNPSDSMRVWVGADGKSPSRFSNLDQSVYVDSSEYLKPSEKADAKGSNVSSFDGWTRAYGGVDKLSLVVLEWYG